MPLSAERLEPPRGHVDPPGRGAAPAASAAPERAPVLGLDVITDWSRFLELRDEWNAVWERSPQRDDLFLTHEWLRAWWEAFGEGHELLVLRLRAGSEPIGYAPLMVRPARSNGLRVRLLSLITNDHTNRAGFVMAERPGDCVDRVLAFLRDESARWDLAELNYLPEDDPTTTGILEAAGRFGLGCVTRPSYHSPRITLEGDWESFYGRRPGHFRRNMRNREKRLGKHGEIRFEEWTDTPSPELLEEMFSVGEKSWKGGEQTALGSTPALRKFYARLAELAAPLGWLSLHMLRAGERPVAFHYSMRKEGVTYLLKTEYDLEFRSFSPGHQIQRRVLEGCFARGEREFDFLGPDMTWKREWADGVRPHVRLLLFHQGARSRLQQWIERKAKPALKKYPLARRLLRLEADDAAGTET